MTFSVTTYGLIGMRAFEPGQMLILFELESSSENGNCN